MSKQIGWLIAGLWLTFAAMTPACAVEYLNNNSFELPVAPLDGNNFYVTIPDWTLDPSPFSSNPANIVVPTAAYANNPQATPKGGGRQYYDMNGVGGIVSQSVTLPTSGKATLSVWFSVRDAQQNLSNGQLRLRDASNSIIASSTVSFVVAEPIGLWKQALIGSMTVPAGTYTFEIIMDNFHNVDLASFDFVADAPAMLIDKTSDKTGPVVLGETITYQYLVTNTGNVAINNVSVSDIHNGFGTAPQPGNEVLHADVAPLGDSTNSIANDNLWDSLQPGDSIRFLSTYVVTQSDIDYLQ